MNAPAKLDSNDILKVRLQALKDEQRSLDRYVRQLESSASSDQILLRRLKKQKLMLKDKVVMIENMLLPDIIA